MKIYRKAQTSSIMYYVNSSPDEILLTPDPEMAKHDEESVPAYILPNGKYFNPDSYISFSEAVLRRLKNKGYMGAIDGDYLHMFDTNALKPLGNYNFIRHTIDRD